MAAQSVLASSAVLSVLLCSEMQSVNGLPSPSDYEITSLPDMNGTIKFKQYSGYMPLGDEDDSAFFFWFVESQNDPANDPVALWLNGGPGSSSIDLGFWVEHGPFRLSPNAEEVELYDYAWNRLASVVYVESPSGVGFSYSNKSSGYNCSDEKSAYQNYLFLLNFFEVFSDFAANDFYLTGESYGGHYIPQLADTILNNDNDLNVKGFLIGNPGINSDWYYNSNEYAFQTYLFQHAYIPQTAWVNSNRACEWDLFLTDCQKDFTHPNAACKAANDLAYQYVPRQTQWDPYDIYAPTCHDNRFSKEDWSVMRKKYNRVLAEDIFAENTPFLENIRRKYFSDSQYVYNPCISQWTPEYMNREDVLKAIHAIDHYTRTWPHHPAGWSYGSETADIALLFPEFFSKTDWRISVISGDADSAVPFIGSQRWIECLNRDVVQDWNHWFLNGDIAGSYKIYDQITFQTIKGCGHTIPTYCPEPGFVFWEQYLNGSINSN